MLDSNGKASIFFLGSTNGETKETKEKSKFAEITEQKRVRKQESCFKSVRKKEISSPLFILSPKMSFEGSFLVGNAKRVAHPDFKFG